MAKHDYKLPKEIVVDRRTWLRGEGGGDSYLLRPHDGKMCCLGSACLQAGFSASEIEGLQCPGQLSKTVSGLRYAGANPGLTPTRFSQRCMQINDRRDLSDAVREQRLQAEARRIRRTFRFIN